MGRSELKVQSCYILLLNRYIGESFMVFRGNPDFKFASFRDILHSFRDVDWKINRYSWVA